MARIATLNLHMDSPPNKPKAAPPQKGATADQEFKELIQKIQDAEARLKDSETRSTPESAFRSH